MKTWSPKATENGWYPKLNPTGTHVLYGFWEAHVADLSSGEEIRIVSPNGARVHPLGWLDATTMLFGTETIKNKPETGPDGIYKVGLGAVRADEVQQVLLFDNDGNSKIVVGWKIPEACNVGLRPADVAFNFGNARGGHWAISNSNRPWNIKDGLPFRKDVRNQYGVYVAGDHLVTTDKDVALLHFEGSLLVRKLPTDNTFLVNEQGDILTGYYGPVKCYPFSGDEKPVDATITPWKKEGIGAVPIRIGDDLWIWTFTELSEGGEVLALGRRLGETDPIVVHDFVGATGGSDVVFVGGGFVLASNSPKGLMTVTWVPIDTPREKLTLPAPPVILPVFPPEPKKFVGTFSPTGEDTPGNLYVFSKGTPLKKAIMASAEGISDVPPDQLMGIWTAHERYPGGVEITLDERIAQLRPLAETFKVPLCIYDDQRIYRTEQIEGWAGKTPWIALPQWYLMAGEDPVEVATDVSAQALQIPVPFMPVVRCTLGAWTIPIPVVQKAMNELALCLAAASDKCIGYLLFNWDRKDGVTGTPELLPFAKAWLETETTINATNARAWATKFFPAPPPPPPPPPPEDDVTDQEIAEVFAGAFFEDIAKLLAITGTVEQRRPKVHAWALQRISWISKAYIDIFKRAADLEGYGSRLLLFLLKVIATETELRKVLQDAYNRGDR